MSQAGGPSEIGAISVGVVADTTQLDPALAAAETKVKQSANRMAAAAVVPIGNKSGAAAPRVGSPTPVRLFTDPAHIAAADAGRMKPVPAAVPQSINEVKKSADNATKSVVELGLAHQRSFHGAVRVVGRATAALAAMTVVARAGAKVLEGIWTGLHGGEVAADKFKASIMDQGVLKQFESQKERLEEINKLLLDRQTMSIAQRVWTAGQHAALKSEEKILISSQKALDDSVKSIHKKTEAERQNEDVRKRSEEGRQEGIERVIAEADAAEEAEALRRERRQGERDDARAREQELLDAAALQADLDEDRRQRTQEIGDAARGQTNPMAQEAVEHNRRLAELSRMQRFAKDDAERKRIQETMDLEVDAMVRGIQRRAQDIGNAIADGIANAMQQQANAAGVQNTTVLLSQIGLAVRSIQQTIPREYSGPMQGIPGGG